MLPNFFNLFILMNEENRKRSHNLRLVSKSEFRRKAGPFSSPSSSAASTICFLLMLENCPVARPGGGAGKVLCVSSGRDENVEPLADERWNGTICSRPEGLGVIGRIFTACDYYHLTMVRAGSRRPGQGFADSFCQTYPPLSRGRSNCQPTPFRGQSGGC
jgi:hypothetical protein